MSRRKRILIRNTMAPGDLVVMSAMVRDIQRSHPGQFDIGIDSSCAAIYEQNPHIVQRNTFRHKGFWVAKYPLIHKSNQNRKHFMWGYYDYFNEKHKTNVRMHEFKPDIHLSDEEKATRPIEEPYWLFASGGKSDFTAKWWDPKCWQQVVDTMGHSINFVQVGMTKKGHNHPSIKGVFRDLRDKTNLRQLINLVYHSEGVCCVVTQLMHLAAAFNKPCVVVAGGREPWWWEAYTEENRLVNMQMSDPNWKPPEYDTFVPHKYLHTIGKLDCCKSHGCWKSKIERTAGSRCKDPFKQNDVTLPRCLAMISAQDVVDSIWEYVSAPAIIRPPDPMLLELPTALKATMEHPPGQPLILHEEAAPGDKEAADKPDLQPLPENEPITLKDQPVPAPLPAADATEIMAAEQPLVLPQAEAPQPELPVAPKPMAPPAQAPIALTTEAAPGAKATAQTPEMLPITEAPIATPAGFKPVIRQELGTPAVKTAEPHTPQAAPLAAELPTAPKVEGQKLETAGTGTREGPAAPVLPAAQKISSQAPIVEPGHVSAPRVLSIAPRVGKQAGAVDQPDAPMASPQVDSAQWARYTVCCVIDGAIDDDKLQWLQRIVSSLPAGRAIPRLLHHGAPDNRVKTILEGRGGVYRNVSTSPREMFAAALEGVGEWIVFIQYGSTPGHAHWLQEVNDRVQRDGADVYGRLHWFPSTVGRMEYPHPAFFVARRTFLENAPANGTMPVALGQLMRERTPRFARYEGSVQLAV